MVNLKYGSSGSDVKKMQEALITAGYNVGSTGADGVFGTNTQKAVQAYQKANGLAVDGIAGSKTLESLYGNGNTPATTPTAPTKTTAIPAAAAATVTLPSGFTYDDFSYEDFNAKADEAFNQANTLLQQHLGAKPGEYVSSGAGEKADEFLKQYESRDPFTYDINKDVMYQQMKDQYALMGHMGMMDAMGQAAAMTGGYGNSYAQTVGQQTYQGYLQQFNDRLPEFYGMALDRYNAEGQKLLDMYGLYSDKENQEYGRHQDSVDAWYRENDRLQGDADRAYGNAWDKYLLDRETAYDDHQAGRDEAWQEYLQEQEDKRTGAELMAGAGDYSRLKEIYGLTDEEVATIQAANTPKVTGGTGGNGNTYKSLVPGSEEYRELEKRFRGATSITQLKSIAREYAAYYDPDAIEMMTAYTEMTEKLTPKSNPLFTGVPVYEPKINNGSSFIPGYATILPYGRK